MKCWDCFSSADVENLVFTGENMTGELYGDILQKNLFRSVNNLKMDKGWVVQHDNDPKQTAVIVKNCLKTRKKKTTQIFSIFSGHESHRISMGYCRKKE